MLQKHRNLCLDFNRLRRGMENRKEAKIKYPSKGNKKKWIEILFHIFLVEEREKRKENA